MFILWLCNYATSQISCTYRWYLYDIFLITKKELYNFTCVPHIYKYILYVNAYLHEYGFIHTLLILMVNSEGKYASVLFENFTLSICWIYNCFSSYTYGYLVILGISLVIVFLNIYSLLVALSKIVSNNTLYIVLLGLNIMCILKFMGDLYYHDIRKNNVSFQRYSNSHSLSEKYIKEH